VLVTLATDLAESYPPRKLDTSPCNWIIYRRLLDASALPQYAQFLCLL